MARERSENSVDASGEQNQPDLSIAEIRQLVSLLDSSDICELVVEQEETAMKLVLRKPVPEVVSLADVDVSETDEFAVVSDEDATTSSSATSVRATLVGIYRSSMAPGGKPLVKVGDSVKPGQIVAAIEALNVVNEVEATTAGKVADILVTDGQPVEYGQPLLTIEAE